MRVSSFPPLAGFRDTAGGLAADGPLGGPKGLPGMGDVRLWFSGGQPARMGYVRPRGSRRRSRMRAGCWNSRGGTAGKGHSRAEQP